MYEKFKYERIALSLIKLDDRNPRIVTQEKLKSQLEIASYFFEHENLSAFIKTIATEGRNPGAERPYVVKDGKNYIVIEGNTRVATYKLLTGQLTPPDLFKTEVPLVSQAMRDELLSVDVAIAPSRDALMAIMARAHFGRGDKSGWRYLGSRKALYDDWKAPKSIAQLSSVFGRTQGQIKDFLLEYMLYVESLSLDWTAAEKEILLKPTIEFNPPVRFLQSTGHKSSIGIELDRTNLQIKFSDGKSKEKFKHLVKKTVIESGGPNATSTYDEVFADFVDPTTKKDSDSTGGNSKSADASAGADTASGDQASEAAAGSSPGGSGGAGPLKPHTLFNYTVTRNDLTLRQLMKEAKGLNTKNFPASGSALLRGIVEVILKLVIEERHINTIGKLLDLEGALNLVIGQAKMNADDVKILKEFKSSHLSYMNLSTHATVVPNYARLTMARDCIDSFVKRNV